MTCLASVDPRLSQGPPPTSAGPGGRASALGLASAAAWGVLRSPKGGTLAVFSQWLVGRPKTPAEAGEEIARSLGSFLAEGQEEMMNVGFPIVFGHRRNAKKVETQNFAAWLGPETGSRQTQERGNLGLLPAEGQGK